MACNDFLDRDKVDFAVRNAKTTSAYISYANAICHSKNKKLALTVVPV